MAEAYSQSEKELIEAAQAGDKSALATLFNTHFPRVYRYMLARTSNPQDAEDLAQEVFIRMLDGLGRFQWRRVPFSAWLFRIAHNIVVSRYRRDGPWVGRLTALSDSISASAMGPEEEVESRLTLEQVLAAAQKLSPTQRQVLELRLAAGLSIAETAQVLGKTENNIKVVQHKAIARLRHALIEMDGAPQGKRDAEAI